MKKSINEKQHNHFHTHTHTPMVVCHYQYRQYGLKLFERNFSYTSLQFHIQLELSSANCSNRWVC